MDRLWQAAFNFCVACQCWPLFHLETNEGLWPAGKKELEWQAYVTIFHHGERRYDMGTPSVHLKLVIYPPTWVHESPTQVLEKLAAGLGCGLSVFFDEHIRSWGCVLIMILA